MKLLLAFSAMSAIPITTVGVMGYFSTKRIAAEALQGIDEISAKADVAATELAKDEVVSRLNKASQASALMVATTTLVCYVISLQLAFFVTRSMIVPIRRITGVLQSAAGGDLSQRVDLQTADEFGELAATVDVLLDRVSDFPTGDAAHPAADRELDPALS